MQHFSEPYLLYLRVQRTMTQQNLFNKGDIDLFPDFPMQVFALLVSEELY